MFLLSSVPIVLETCFSHIDHVRVQEPNGSGASSRIIVQIPVSLSKCNWAWYFHSLIHTQAAEERIASGGCSRTKVLYLFSYFSGTLIHHRVVGSEVSLSFYTQLKLLA